MPPRLIEPLRPHGLPRARCKCRECGAHVITRVGRVIVEGSCSNCGSFDLVPVGRVVARERRFVPSLGH